MGSGVVLLPELVDAELVGEGVEPGPVCCGWVSEGNESSVLSPPDSVSGFGSGSAAGTGPGKTALSLLYWLAPLAVFGSGEPSVESQIQPSPAALGRHSNTGSCAEADCGIRLKAIAVQQRNEPI